MFSYDDYLKLRDEHVAVKIQNEICQRSVEESKTKLERKERWVIIQGDTLCIYKDRNSRDAK
jgi:hypothetical protein